MSPAFIDNDGRLDWRKIGYHARSAFAVLLSLAVLVGGGWFIYGKANDAYIAWRTTDSRPPSSSHFPRIISPPHRHQQPSQLAPPTPLIAIRRSPRTSAKARS